MLRYSKETGAFLSLKKVGPSQNALRVLYYGVFWPTERGVAGSDPCIDPSTPAPPVLHRPKIFQRCLLELADV